MKLWCSLLLTLSFATALAEEAAPNTLSAAEKAERWKLLFDGSDVSAHWRGYKKDKLPDKWVVEAGALVRKGGGDIVTKEQYESFEFSLDWKITEGGNSGLMFKVQETDGPPYVTGPEVQIQDNSRAMIRKKPAGCINSTPQASIRPNPWANGTAWC